LGSGDKSGPYFNNPRNLRFIISGDDTNVSGLVKPRKMILSRGVTTCIGFIIRMTPSLMHGAEEIF
jgi:hypothetical protein